MVIVPMSSTRPMLERCSCLLLLANSRAQLRKMWIRSSGGNWAKNSSMRPGGNGVGVVDVVAVAAVAGIFIS